MEENRNLEEVLARIEESERKQEKYMRRQYLLTMVMALCCVGVLCAVILAYQNIVPAAQEAILSIAGVTEDLGAISKQLTEADLQQIKTDSEKLEVFQKTAETPEILAQIPLLEISEIDEKHTKL